MKSWFNTTLVIALDKHHYPKYGHCAAEYLEHSRFCAHPGIIPEILDIFGVTLHLTFKAVLLSSLNVSHAADAFRQGYTDLSSPYSSLMVTKLKYGIPIIPVFSYSKISFIINAKQHFSTISLWRPYRTEVWLLGLVVSILAATLTVIASFFRRRKQTFGWLESWYMIHFAQKYWFHERARFRLLIIVWIVAGFFAIKYYRVAFFAQFAKLETLPFSDRKSLGVAVMKGDYKYVTAASTKSVTERWLRMDPSVRLAFRSGTNLVRFTVHQEWLDYLLHHRGSVTVKASHGVYLAKYLKYGITVLELDGSASRLRTFFLRNNYSSLAQDMSRVMRIMTEGGIIGHIQSRYVTPHAYYKPPSVISGLHSIALSQYQRAARTVIAIYGLSIAIFGIEMAAHS